MSIGDRELQHKTIKETIDYILVTYHAPLKKNLKVLENLVRNMEIDYGDDYNDAIQIAELFCQFRREILKHIIKEEIVMFPAMIEFEKTHEKIRENKDYNFNEIEKTISNVQMKNEHQDFDTYLNTLVELCKSSEMNNYDFESFEVLKRLIIQVRKDTDNHAYCEDTTLYNKANTLKELLKEEIFAK